MDDIADPPAAGVALRPLLVSQTERPGGTHDQAVRPAGKELFQRYPRGWLAMIGWPVPADDGGLAVIDSDLSTVSRAADKLVRVDGVPVAYLAHVEFQSGGDPGLDRRMLVYNVLARGQHQLPVRSVAVLFRPAAAAGPTGRFAERLDEESWVEFAYRRINLWQLPTDGLLAGPVGTVPLPPPTVGEDEVRSVVAAVGRRLGAELARGPAADLLEVTRQLLGVKFDESRLRLIMPASLQKPIEDESWTYKQTVERGRVEGRVEGRAEGRHEQLVELGTDKLGPPAAATVARINAITDVEELRQLARRLLRVDRWDALFSQD